jgi:soluble lytic murein transglycosylase-like protein
VARVAGRLGDRLGARGRAGLLVAAAVIAACALFAAWSRARQADWERVEDRAPQIVAAARESGMDPYLLAGLVYTESRGRADAVSSADARGLCQLKDATASEMAARLGVRGEPPYPPAVNLRLGAAYLALHVERMQGDVNLGLLCYRVGPGRAAREIARTGGGEAWLAELRAEGGPGLWNYCEQVHEAAEEFRARERDGRTRAWSAAGAGSS